MNSSLRTKLYIQMPNIHTETYNYFNTHFTIQYKSLINFIISKYRLIQNVVNNK